MRATSLDASPVCSSLMPVLAIAFIFGIAGCSKTPDAIPVPKPKTGASDGLAVSTSVQASASPVDDAGIAWQHGDIDGAFATARSQNKPLFLYWGATWCPPCNQVKATIFNRQDFIERSRFFIPVYLDGDAPKAQHLGQRFNVSGYPTMILFRPDGAEITRLPGEVDADQYMRVLAMGMNGARPVKETLAAALAGDKTREGIKRSTTTMSADDWRMLAYYSWDTDDHQLIPDKDLPRTLARLAQACPAEESATGSRLALRALVAEATAKGATPRPNKARADAVMAIVTEPALARDNFDLVVYYADNVVEFVTAPRSPDRAKLASAWTSALDTLVVDRSLSTADHLAAIQAQVALARLDVPKTRLPEAMLDRVRAEATRADLATKDPYARQSVVSAAADLLGAAGLMRDSNALLEAELRRSHSPHYFMSALAENARKSGDRDGALAWYRKAYEASSGPATRLQWGTRYVRALIDLSPLQTDVIEKAALGVIGELDPTPDSFYARNGRSLTLMGIKLAGWASAPQHGSAGASLSRIRSSMASVCARLPTADAARPACDNVFKAPARVA